MAKLTRIKGYDDYGYEVIDTFLPTMDEALENAHAIGEVMIQVGISAQEMTEALRKVSELLARAEWAADEITAIKDSLADLQYKCEGTEGALSARIDLLEYKLDELRSDMDARTEIPNQKDDLEISNRIVPSEDFLILGSVGWSSDIVNLDQTNMFLN